MLHSIRASGLEVLGRIFLRGVSLITLAAKITLTASATACTSVVSNPEDRALAAAEQFLNAFYSWQPERLRRELADELPDAERDRVLYYQAWAEAGNYQVQHQAPCKLSPNDDKTNIEVSCAVTVTDDLGGTMGYVATDTFMLQVSRTSSRLTGVHFEGDDPPIFMAMLDWLARTQPQVMSGPCDKMFNGGTRPAECVRAVVQGAKEYLRLPHVDTLPTNNPKIRE